MLLALSVNNTYYDRVHQNYNNGIPHAESVEHAKGYGRRRDICNRYGGTSFAREVKMITRNKNDIHMELRVLSLDFSRSSQKKIQ